MLEFLSHGAIDAESIIYIFIGIILLLFLYKVWGMTDDVNFIKKMMKDKLEEDKKKEKGN